MLSSFSLCLHKAGLSKICNYLGAKLKNEEGSNLYPSVRHYLDAKVGRPVKTGPGGLLSGHWIGNITIDLKLSEDDPSPVRKGRKRKVVEQAATIDQPKTKRQRAKKPQLPAAPIEDDVIEGIARPSSMSPEGESSRSRTIKLTFKAKATAEEEEQRRQRLKHDKAVRSVNMMKSRKVQFAKPPVTVTTVRRGRPPGSSKKSVPQIIEAANVWVKSKADVAASSSDSELEESTWRTMSPDEEDGSDEEMCLENTFGDGVMDSDFDDGAEQDNEVEEETVDSPQDGQVEFTHHPELTMTEYPSNPPHSIFQNNGINPFAQDIHAPFPPPNGPELTDFIQHLMGAGVI